MWRLLDLFHIHMLSSSWAFSEKPLPILHGFSKTILHLSNLPTLTVNSILQGHYIIRNGMTLPISQKWSVHLDPYNFNHFKQLTPKYPYNFQTNQI